LFHFDITMRIVVSTKELVACLLIRISISNAFVTQPRRNGGMSSYTSTRLQIGKDTKIVYGSDSNNGVSYGENEEEEDDYVKEQVARQAVVAKLLEEQDAEFKEDRRRKTWGEFADATSKEDIKKVEESIRQKIAFENEQKATLAKKQGVELEVLEPQDSGVFEENGNIQITAGTFYKLV
jgi:hypothetical protein